MLNRQITTENCYFPHARKSFLFFKTTHLLACVLALVFTALPTASPSQAQGFKKAFMPSYNQELFFKNRYRKIQKQWAYAIGPYGDGANWTFRARSAKQARVFALRNCRKSIRRKKYKKLGCKILAHSGQGKFRYSTRGPAVGAAMKLPDKPYLTGFKTSLPNGETPRGVLLIIHGCKGNFDAPLIKKYAKVLLTRKFITVSPNSFADTRPDSLCGKSTTNTFAKRDNISRIRQAQTRRTILMLQKKYKDVPIYAWGHSEGGLVAQRITRRIAGIIATGMRCQTPKTTRVGRNVRFLIIAGGKDFAFWRLNEKRTLRQARKICKITRSSKQWQMQFLPNISHKVAPASNKKLAALFAKFLNIKQPALIVETGRKKILVSEKFMRAVEKYKRLKSPKAFAFGPNGAAAIRHNGKSKTQTTIKVLNLCNQRIKKAARKAGKKSCRLLAVNNKFLIEPIEKKLQIPKTLLSVIYAKGHLKLSRKQIRVWAKYRSHRSNTAAAIGPNGAIYISRNRKSSSNAIHRALTGCSLQLGWKVSNNQKPYLCKLMALNRQVFFKSTKPAWR